MVKDTKIRVYQLARDLDVESKDLLELCKQAGFDVKNQLSNLSPEQCDALTAQVKRGPAVPAKPAMPAKPVTPVLAPERRAVPTLPTARPKREEARPAPEPEEVAATMAPAAPVEAPAEAPVEVPAAAVAPPEPVAPTPSAPPSLPSVPVRSMPNLSTPRERVQALPPKPAVMPKPAAAPPAPPPATAATSKPATPPPAAPPSVRPPVRAPLPNVSAGKSPPDLSRSGAPRIGGPGAPRRTEGRPGLPPLRPIAPPSLKPMKPLAPPTGKTASGEKTVAPAVKMSKEILDRMRTGGGGPLRPEDLTRPAQPAGAVPEGEDDDKDNKNKKLKEIPGRDKRKEDRNKRKTVRDTTTRAENVEIRQGKIVTELDDLPGRNSIAHRLRKQRQKQIIAPKPKGKIEVEPPLTIRTLSEALGVKQVELMFKMRGHGAPPNISINTTVDQALAELIALDYGCELVVVKPSDHEDVLLAQYAVEDTPEDMQPRAPIVTIMGHVDHGKTTLLDKIRASNVAATEAGGITQVIRAWRVEHEGKPITFLDTPGHEAFTKMRARGAQVTDIAVIVVAADDGVMPQTEEAIQHAKAAGVALVVCINKIDMPQANIERTKRQLYTLNVLPDNMGGDTPFVETSAHTGKGIDDLLEAISVVAELKELTANPNKPGEGTCLEAMLSEGEGVRATLLVRDGTLRRGDTILCGATYGRIRQLYNDQGQPIQEAGPSVPVRITGLDEVPNADDPFQALPDLSVARTIADQRRMRLMEAAQHKRVPMTLERLGEIKVQELKVILKADFRGSVEAIRKELEKLTHEEVRVRVLEAGIGAITETDVWLALTSPDDTMIVGFNAVPDDRARALAEEKAVQIREYNIIYDLTNDIKSALEGKLKPREDVVHLGRAIVRDTFKVSRVGTIAGCYVTQGSIKRNAKVRVIREGVVIYPPADRSASLESLKRFKDDVGEVREGFECGMKVAGYDDIKVGDVIEAYRVEQVQRTLDMAAAGK